MSDVEVQLSTLAKLVAEIKREMVELRELVRRVAGEPLREKQ